MLTRLRVNGFKNLVEVDLRFGPFTCIAGVNGVGKSNLFDVIGFLAALSEKTLLDAALSVRSEGSKTSDLRGIFNRVGDRYSDEISLDAEMLVSDSGVDDLGQEARAAITFLSYGLTIGLEGSGLAIRREELKHITVGEAKKNLLFPHTQSWRKSVVTGRRASPFISTERSGSSTIIKLHQDVGKNYKGGGRPHTYVAGRLPRTVLSEANSSDSATAVLARREMQSWRLLQLEPSGLRQPDRFIAPRSIARNGAHLPATLARLAHLNIVPGIASPASSHGDLPDHAATVYARVANRLSELIEDARSVRVVVDDRRELLSLLLTERNGTEHEAQSLSDGTLRFLALAILETDSDAKGVLCLEEPENGIHPRRVPAMLRLLQDLAVDPQVPVSMENPLRQVIVNTHSPAVAAQVPEDCLLVGVQHAVEKEGRRANTVAFHSLPGTWRAREASGLAPIAMGEVAMG